MDSRLRGNDIKCIAAVIPAKAGIRTASTEHDCAIREGGPGGATSTQTRPFSGGMTSVFTFFYMFR